MGRLAKVGYNKLLTRLILVAPLLGTTSESATPAILVPPAGFNDVRLAERHGGGCSETEVLIMPKYIILAAAFMLSVPAYAEPARIIIARHAEKGTKYALCDMGTERAKALAAQYLGRGATAPLFPAGHRPDAMLAMTMHTIDTITPAARSWNLPVIAYAIIPAKDEKDEEVDQEENQRTQEAAHDVLMEPTYAGKNVVMVWEHKRIASAKLEKKFFGALVTLRQLLHLDQVAAVPATWPDQTYDYFWIVDFAPGNLVPVSFHMLRQEFSAPFNDLPANGWEEGDTSHIKAGCKD
jgi:hypothetical protein